MAKRGIFDWKAAGFPLSTASDEAARLFDEAVGELYAWKGDPVETTRQALRADPDFLLGKAFISGLDLLSTGIVPGNSSGLDTHIEQVVAAIDSPALTERERSHAKAIQQLAKGDLRGANLHWERILVSHPCDAIALRFLNDSLFFLGESRFIKDVNSAVLPHWNKHNRDYSFVLGMTAFGLEEAGLYRSAEDHAKQALSLCVHDTWATHARAHVFEMEGHATEGEEFLIQTENDWKDSLGLACHNYWHLALYRIELGRHHEALDIFDHKMATIGTPSMLDLVDMAALLFRLELEDVSVGSRWASVWIKWQPHLRDHLTAFNDAHIAMALLGATKLAGQTDDVSGDSNARYDDNNNNNIDSWLEECESFFFHGSGAHKALTDAIGRNIVLAIVAFKRHQYTKAIELLLPVRNHIDRIGGSHAQRDVFHQLLIQSALRSGEAAHSRLAHHLLTERHVARPNSLLTQRLQQRLAYLIERAV